jgi:hypothetical protein
LFKTIMNTKQTLGLLAALVLSASALLAKPIPGPKGGRVLTEAAPHAEFFVDASRHVVISFYDVDLKPVPAAGQVASVTAEAPDGKVKLEFAEKDGALVSTAPLPASDGYRVVVQLKANATAKQTNYRLEYHTETCGECKRAEYACACDEAGGDHSGHAH